MRAIFFILFLILSHTALASVIVYPAGGVPSVLEPKSWDYSPSWMHQPYFGDRIWWTGGNGTNGGDAIYYSTNNGTGWSPASPSIPVLVSNGAGSWEGDCVADPAVVKGSFSVSGNIYSLAMYYTASANCNYNNKIGVAFSNDGINWIKYSGNPILGLSNPPVPNNNYGIGQPQVRNWDGGSGIQIWYTQTVPGCDGQGGAAGGLCATITEAISTNGINFQAVGTLSTIGIPYNTMAAAAISLGLENGVYYLYFMNKTTMTGDGHLRLYRIPYLNRFSGSWQELAHVVPTPPYTNLFEPGFRTDIYGNLPSTSLIHAGFACGGSDPTTWNLCQAGFSL